MQNIHQETKYSNRNDFNVHIQCYLLVKRANRYIIEPNKQEKRVYFTKMTICKKKYQNFNNQENYCNHQN